jgi:hypothetical protein
MIRFFAGLVLACLVTSPVFAAECGLKMDDQIAKLKSQGDTIAADFMVHGDHMDRMVIDIDGNGIYLLRSKDGCVVGSSPMLDTVPRATSPAGAKPSGLRFDNTASASARASATKYVITYEDFDASLAKDTK